MLFLRLYNRQSLGFRHGAIVRRDKGRYNTSFTKIIHRKSCEIFILENFLSGDEIKKPDI